MVDTFINANNLENKDLRDRGIPERVEGVLAVLAVLYDSAFSYDSYLHLKSVHCDVVCTLVTSKSRQSIYSQIVLENN